MTDYELYQILEENGYKTTEKNLAIIKEGLDSGKYDIVTFEEAFNDIILNDDYDVDYLCECFDSLGLTDDELDNFTEEFNNYTELLDQGVENLSESAIGDFFKKGFYKGKKLIKKAATGRTVTGAGGAVLSGKTGDVNRKLKDYKSLQRRSKGKDIKYAGQEAGYTWNGKTKAEKATARSKVKEAKSKHKQTKKDNKIKYNGDSDTYTVNGASFRTRKEAKSKRKENIKTSKNARNDVIRDNTKRGQVSKAKEQAKIDYNKRMAKGAHDARASLPTGTKFADITESSFSDYDLYQILENNGYKTTEKNLQILKEGIESGKYVLD